MQLSREKIEKIDLSSRGDCKWNEFPIKKITLIMLYRNNHK